MQDLTKSQTLIARERAVYAGIGRIPYAPLTIARAKGPRVWDLDGNAYLDAFSASCTANIGFNHPEVLAAAKAQIDEVVQYPAVYAWSEGYTALAEDLAAVTPIDGPKKVFFGLTGSDANDLVIKLARAFTGRRRIVAFHGGFYGSLFGSGAMTDLVPGMKELTGPYVPEVTHVDYPTCYRCPLGKTPDRCGFACMAGLKDALADAKNPVAAVVIEPILGDGGLYVPPPGYMPELARFCREAGALLCVDEVQQGLGRAGHWASVENFGVKPDIVTYGKSLGGGFPISAVVARAEIFDAPTMPIHGFSMAAHMTSAAAGRTVLKVIERDELLDRSMRLGALARARFEALQARCPLIGDIRGIGLNLGIDLVTDHDTRQGARTQAAAICEACFERGVMLIFLGDGILRFQPPLTISEADLSRLLDVIETAILDAAEGRLSLNEAAAQTGW